MDYMDEEILEARWELERQKHTTLETGMYAGEELITFTPKEILKSGMVIPLPDQFAVMPEDIKDIKYPSKNAPQLILTSLDSTVNLCFNILPVVLHEDALQHMSSQFQGAVCNMNPSLKIGEEEHTQTEQGNEMIWFGYRGYHLDGQSFNRVYLIQMRKSVLYSLFSCKTEDKDKWLEIIENIFSAAEERM